MKNKKDQLTLEEIAKLVRKVPSWKIDSEYHPEDWGELNGFPYYKGPAHEAFNITGKIDGVEITVREERKDVDEYSILVKADRTSLAYYSSYFSRNDPTEQNAIKRIYKSVERKCTRSENAIKREQELQEKEKISNIFKSVRALIKSKK